MSDELPGDVVIRTPDQRLRVFVSSTLGELAKERRAALHAISTLRLTPVLFELGARPHPPRELYRAYLAQSDVFIGLYWERYGQIVPGAEFSGLEEEFELSRALPRLLYVKTPAPDREPRLTSLLSRIKQQASYRTFQTPVELERLVRDDLATLLSERFVPGRRPVAGSGSEPKESMSRRGPRPLPVDTTSLVGRERDVDEVAALVGQSNARLVTLTGPGGVGKTRLALAVGERLRDRFGAGTVFVSLAAVTEPELVPTRIGRAVGAEAMGMGTPLEALVERLGDDSWLLILDNLEQVVDAARDLDELLARCPGVSLLATSRTVLGLRAEREYPVAPLALPAERATALEELATAPAVALFVDRARAVRHDFALTEGNAAAVAAICRRLEGLPLAIELAAARTRLLDPAAVVRRLATSLDALGTGTVDMPERQRTLRATVEWSMGLLDEGERSLLETMAVFVDGWTLEAAADVAGLDQGQALQLTEALARHSLLQLVYTEFGPRSRMLETIREFVCERLTVRADFAEVRRRHADYYRDLAGHADRELRGLGHNEWLERLRIEAGNLVAAIHFYLAHDRASLPHLFRALWTFWELQDRMREARAWVEQLLPTADSLDPQARAELLWAALVTAIEVGDDAAALTASTHLGSLLDGIKDPYLHAVSQLVMAWASPIVGDSDGALRGALASLEQLRSQEEPYWTTVALVTTGFLETAAGRCNDALDHLREARDLAERLDNAWLVAICLVWLGTLALMRDRLDEGRAVLNEALDVSLRTQSTNTIALCLVGFARWALMAGDAKRAALLTGAAEGLRLRVGLRVWPSLRRGEVELGAQVREALGTEQFETAFSAGARLNQRGAVAAARGLHGAESGM